MEWDIISNPRHTTEAILLTPAFYMWPLFSCTAHSFTKRYLSSSDRASFIFEVLSYINATSKLHKKESLFSWLYKISLWPTSFKFTIYREKRYFNTGVRSKNIKFQLKSWWLRNLGKIIGFQRYEFVLPANLGKTKLVCRILSQITWSPCMTFHTSISPAQHSVCPREN